MISWQIRSYSSTHALALERAGAHPVLARVLASRGVCAAQWVQAQQHKPLQGLLPPSGLLGIQQAVDLLLRTFRSGGAVCVIGDYDCDGATATAVAVRGLRLLAEALAKEEGGLPSNIDFLVPNRFKDGYGLSPAIVDLAIQQVPGLVLLVTVDNGIASVAGVAHAKSRGLNVLVTDHHLPGDSLPVADAIVNPNQPGCAFASKAMAGVGVMFYVLLALRAAMREQYRWSAAEQPRLDGLLDLVALGTVADVVRLDDNNRLLVQAGLERLRAGRCQPGVAALFHVAGREPRQATATDLGFIAGPRLNAAGRLADMSLGIRTLISDDPGQALSWARELDVMNRERKAIEHDMRAVADVQLEQFDPASRASIVVHDAQWHQGVIGILASRLKERFYRPSIVLAPGDHGYWKGSGRSIPGIHLRDMLDLVVKRLPEGAVPAFGGHAMAAGLTLLNDYLPDFSRLLEEVIREQADPSLLQPVLLTDGELDPSDFSLTVVDLLQQQVWGAGFAVPVFTGTFQVLSQRLLKDAHSKFALQFANPGRLAASRPLTALWWGHTESVSARVRVAFRLERDSFSTAATSTGIQLIIEALEVA